MSMTTQNITPNNPLPPVEQARAVIDDGWAWMQLHGGELLVAAAAGTIIYLVLRFIRRWVRSRATAHTAGESVGATILRTLARTRHFFLIMASARLVAGYANAPAVIDQTIRFLFILAFALQAAIWAKEVVMTLVRQRAHDGGSETLANAQSVINVLVSIALFTIAAVVVLDNVGVNVTGLIAGLGIGGIAIGLAAKGVFEDLFAALAIIFDRPFRKGDSIRFDQTTATVERIGLKTTRLRALTGEEVIISNTHLLSKQIGNYARIHRRRIILPIGIDYATPLDRLQQAQAIAETVVTGQNSDMIRSGITGFGAASLDFEVQFDVESDDYAAVFAARHAIAMGLLSGFAAAGIIVARPPSAT
jgi:small-conductance mechanosensitive channel